MLSLSTCWNSHRFIDGREIAREARDMGFEFIEISHGTNVSLVHGLLQAFNAGEIRVSSVHNFCPSPIEVLMDAPDVYEFSSPKPADRERAINLTKQSIQTAVRFGVNRVVMHMGSVPMKPVTAQLEALAGNGEAYSRKFTDLKLRLVEQREKASILYLDRARAALRELLPVAQQHQVALAIETRSHFEQVPNETEMLQLLSDFGDTPWIGAWHDFGHVQRQANLGLLDHAQYLAAIAPRLLGCHVHDVAWPAKDHRIPFTGGCVDFDRLLPLVPKGTPLVWELSPSQKKVQIMERLSEWQARYSGHPAHAPAMS
jgi:sugar phosphate isomerase/epimerase